MRPRLSLLVISMTLGLVLILVSIAASVNWRSFTHTANSIGWQRWCAIGGGAIAIPLLTVVISRQPGYDSSRSWWRTATLIVVPIIIFTTAALVILLNSVHVSSASERIEIIKTALTIGGGTGGVVALLLAGRRQWSTERANADVREDAIQRRITELYTKSADQLGSDKAPVRLAGLYALERLAQENDNQRQTIVNLICAYLRMPLQSATMDDGGTLVDAVTSESLQERQVRLAAQRILSAHLDPGSDMATLADEFWPDVDIDLSGALLLDFKLLKCQVRRADFTGTTFAEHASFSGTKFTAGATFVNATFRGHAVFEDTLFDSWVRFDGAVFEDDVVFSSAIFNRYSRFYRTTFKGESEFGEDLLGERDSAHFNDVVHFVGARFEGDARFEGVLFEGDVEFGDGGLLTESAAYFSDKVTFSRATFSGYAGFGTTEFRSDADFDRATFRSTVDFEGSLLEGEASFNGARVELNDTARLPRSRWLGNWVLRPADNHDSQGVLELAEEANSNESAEFDPR